MPGRLLNDWPGIQIHPNSDDRPGSDFALNRRDDAGSTMPV